MDQHAVAERVIFEKMRQEYDSEQITLLSVPLTFEVKNLNKNVLEKLNKLGFDISEFGKNKVILYAIPKVLERYKVDVSALVNNLLWSDPEDL
jgi:DNA mismatch repair ATPase MutL